MILNIAGQTAYAYTGGKPFDPALPTAVFLHGAEHDHSVWILQTRYFAHHGFNVLAVDLPGHHRSTGAPLTSIEALADWTVALLDAVGVARALLIGHSMGSLIALEAAARYPERVEKIALVGTAYPMKVSDALLDAAAHREAEAIDMVNTWSHASIANKPSFPAPGFWMHGGNQRLMERVSRSNPAQVFLIDFSACNSYQNGLAAAARVRCPALFVLGRRDVMTPPRAAQTLVDTMTASGVTVDTALLDAGHAMMGEQPDATLDALYGFARR
ncbi:MAG: alpha/beta hydrolase [Burkholderiales bacterium]|nr:alpha/beta hydrolase [Burkholderiales bacterium]